MKQRARFDGPRFTVHDPRSPAPASNPFVILFLQATICIFRYLRGDASRKVMTTEHLLTEIVGGEGEGEVTNMYMICRLIKTNGLRSQPPALKGAYFRYYHCKIYPLPPPLHPPPPLQQPKKRAVKLWSTEPMKNQQLPTQTAQSHRNCETVEPPNTVQINDLREGSRHVTETVKLWTVLAIG